MEAALDQTISQHLNAIGQRDLTAYLQTVHDSASIVLPSGQVVIGRPAVEEFHTEWFADPDWRLEYTIKHREIVGDTAVVLCDVDYHDVDGDGKPYQLRYILSLVFIRTADGWLLLHDQNTFC